MAVITTEALEFDEPWEPRLAAARERLHAAGLDWARAVVQASGAVQLADYDAEDES